VISSPIDLMNSQIGLRNIPRQDLHNLSSSANWNTNSSRECESDLITSSKQNVVVNTKHDEKSTTAPQVSGANCIMNLGTLNNGVIFPKGNEQI